MVKFADAYINSNRENSSFIWFDLTFRMKNKRETSAIMF